MNRRTWKVALLLFGSGTCALIYQVAWLREFRLVFGASTAASAAVLAIFMGGLGAGGLLLGRRADRHPVPLRFYAQLELLIAVSAALTPGLIWLVRHLYLALGGSVSLGLIGATVLRLALSTLVLAVPTVLMGGTLPAAARSIETDDDLGRRRLAALYGTNTLGAVTGALLTTFVLLEALGTHRALWAACLMNVLVSALAWWLAQSKAASRVSSLTSPGASRRETSRPAQTQAQAGMPTRPAIPPRFVLILAGVVGFAFFLMEMVWYRMLAPLLGGTTYTLGLILAVALLGIGLGGVAYALLGRNRVATVSGLATTCAVEGLFVALPFALGDRLAVLAALLRGLGSAGFSGNILGWSIVTLIVVFPVAFVAGIQFPLLIALLGQGARDVGRHTGAAYAWNTAGAILGSLAGGFGLLPLLGALGTWRAAAILLAAFSAAAAFVSMRAEKKLLRLAAPAAAALIAMALLFSTGPTAAWRYSAIGAGRAKIGTTRNEIRDWMHARRRLAQWTAEGVESNICITNANGIALLNNGKSDGNVKLDASTVVMLGITGGILHPNPKSALVVGLGTGTTAGWLAAIPSVERVDVVELEPAVREVARRCSPANQNALDNPKVHVIIADAREVLLASTRRYDLIVSQPSNPFRAGLSSLFSREFYEAVRARLNDGGILLQWVQAYEIDVNTLRSVYATLTSVFRTVETWQTTPDDMLLVCSQSPIRYDVGALRRRIQDEPFKSALLYTWRAIDLEGFLARFVAKSSLAEYLPRRSGAQINTDDRNPLEYAFARTVGQDYTWSLDDLKNTARLSNADRPDITGGDVDWARVEDERICMHVAEGYMPTPDESLLPDQRRRAEAQISYMKGNTSDVLSIWQQQPRQPSNPTELAVVALSLADHGKGACLGYIDQLRRYQPGEADAILAHLLMKQGKLPEAAQALVATFERSRFDPWPWISVTSNALKDAATVAAQDRSLAEPLLQALRQPFVVYILNEERIFNMVSVSAKISLSASVEAMQAYEPDVPWMREFLARRLEWYQNANDPMAAIARRDLEEFMHYEPAKLPGTVAAEPK
jgi:spermidine synthase